MTKHYINADVSRACIARLLKLEGMARLRDVIPKAEGETTQRRKTFKVYELGFVHPVIRASNGRSRMAGSQNDHRSTNFLAGDAAKGPSQYRLYMPNLRFRPIGSRASCCPSL